MWNLVTGAEAHFPWGHRVSNLVLNSSVSGQERVRQLLRPAGELQQQRGTRARERALVDQHLDNFLKVFKDSIKCQDLAMRRTGPKVPILVLHTRSRRALTTVALIICGKPLLEPLRAPPPRSELRVPCQALHKIWIEQPCARAPTFRVQHALFKPPDSSEAFA